MAQFDLKKHALVGPGGLLAVLAGDEVAHKLAMLIEGECEGLGPLQAAQKFGYSKQRYFQLRAAFAERGAMALQSRKRGPKTHCGKTAADRPTPPAELQPSTHAQAPEGPRL